MRTMSLWTLSAAAFFLLTFSSCIPDSSVSSASVGGVKAGFSNRKLKDMISSFDAATTNGESNGYNLEDYPGHDPAPNSKVDVHSGPIENGSPIMPYFIKPTPPSHPGKLSP